MLHTQGFEITRVMMDFPRRSSMGLYVLQPLVKLYTRRTMRKETDPRQRRANRHIRKVLTSPPLLLGRTLIVVARKHAPRQVVRTILASEI